MNITHDPAAEIATLSAALQSLPARKEVKRHLAGEDFYEPGHEVIWEAMCRLDRERQPVDSTTVGAALVSDKRASAAFIEVMTSYAIPENAPSYAETVRSWATRRRLYAEAIRVQQAASNPEVDAAGLAAAVVNRFSQLRDSGAADDAQSITLGELLATPDDEPDWVIPGLLERRDRFMLTGGEGLGKSYLLRQIAILAASGLDPFSLEQIRPASVLIVDCENSLNQVKRKARAVVEFGQKHGKGRPDQVNLLATGRIDVLRDKDLAAIHREIDAIRPDIIVIGPIYAMSPKALMTDDDAVPVLAALDGMRESGACLLMEAHAGHTAGPEGRNLRPRGSSSLLGWPEFGYGLKAVAEGYADLVPWRGDRDSRKWPQSLRYDRDRIRWVEHDGRGFEAESSRGWSPPGGRR